MFCPCFVEFARLLLLFIDLELTVLLTVVSVFPLSCWPEVKKFFYVADDVFTPNRVSSVPGISLRFDIVSSLKYALVLAATGFRFLTIVYI